MYDWHRKSLLCVKGIRTSPIPWLRVLQHHSCSPQVPSYSTALSCPKQSLRVSFLVNNCGFSPETASELCKRASFVDSEKPDAVLNILRNLNISDSRIRDTIKKEPLLLSCDPVTNISPKLDFFKSKGASTSQLANILTANPRLVRQSLKNSRDTYDLINRFLRSDEWTMKSIKRYSKIITDNYLAQKVKLLQDYGVPESVIASLFRHWSDTLACNIDELIRKADEIKDLGFHPSKISFTAALRCKVVASKSSWERKVELFVRWGWSDEILHKAFRKYPFCMLTSESKIEAVMIFFVNHMGWDSSVLAEYPVLLGLSLEKRIIPRASVLQFLQSRGLIKNHACVVIPFRLVEEMFLKKFVHCFKDEAPQLLNLYEEKLNLSR